MNNAKPNMKTSPCRWIIEFTLTLDSPMHLGTGQDIQPDPNGSWIADICLDEKGKPTIPGASLKGGMQALANRTGQLHELARFFGEAKSKTTTPGLAEFRYGICQTPAVSLADQAHVAIDRVTGTAMDKKLFSTRVVPAGTAFKFQIVLHQTTQAEMEKLLGFLQSLTPDRGFSLGAQAGKSLGKLHLHGSCLVKRFGPAEAKQWFVQASTSAKPPAWQDFAIKHTSHLNSLATIALPKPCTLAVSLKFDSPFMVKGGVDNTSGHDVAVPRMQADRVLLPSSSFSGRLRSQAERILRTLGFSVPQGHDAQAWRKGNPHTDLAAFLFGCAGWRGIVSSSDCVDEKKSTLRTHDMVAIDRFTGGGKDGAKFAAQAAECPTLQGVLQFDLKRLKAAGDNVCWQALGLMSLLLRDLAEGDIRFGHGTAKGFGHGADSSILDHWKQLLTQEFPAPPNGTASAEFDPVQYAVEALRKGAPPTPPAGLPRDATIPTADFTPFTPTAAAEGFHNPYHFVPLSKAKAEDWTTPEQLKASRGHDQYNGLCGSITVQMTTRTPLFIGANRTQGLPGQPATLEGFQFQGQRAVPATSLRGMVSSVFESVSASRLRVLHPQAYSMRKAQGNALSAMGRIVVQGNDFYLKPLTLPTMNCPHGHVPGNVYQLQAKWQTIPAFSHANTDGYAPLRVYFDVQNINTYQKPGPFYMELHGIPWNGTEITNMPELRQPAGRHQFLIGQKPLGLPISKAEYNALTPAQQANYFRGWVRTLKTPGRSAGANQLLPSTVRHLVFLPDDGNTNTNVLLPVTPKAYHLFHEIADLAKDSMPRDCTITNDNLLPFVPAGRATGKDRLSKPAHTTRLQDGDIVFFDVDDAGKICEISFSSIWRTGIRAANSNKLATTADLLAQFDPHLLPLGMGTGPHTFSGADLLFGVVEHRPEGGQAADAQPQEQATALAGRVVFSMGVSAQAVQTEAAITLKELSSPKPPSPALYFKPLQENAQNAYVSKANLAQNPASYALRGRKAYLHALRSADGTVSPLNNQGIRVANPDDNARLPWVSEHNNQQDEGNNRRVRIEPISAGQCFRFQVDFNNLTETELAQLCASLMPDPAFEHRLGMGKPLGLGSVKLCMEKMELVDRQKRYAEDDLTTPRIHTTLVGKDLEHLAAQGMASAPNNVRRALQLLGNPAAVTRPVHYPQNTNSTLEHEHFKWFMANDKTDQHAPPNNQQALKSLNANSTALPTLRRY
ncbi:MAG: hypothetical protein RLZZ352_1710 [Pseudomonadota bacterium]|jgi:CRISPR-associated protein (TIGR03986 family)